MVLPKSPGVVRRGVLTKERVEAHCKQMMQFDEVRGRGAPRIRLGMKQ